MTKLRVTLRIFHKYMFVDPNIDWRRGCRQYCKFNKICGASYCGRFRFGASFYDFCSGKRYIDDFTIVGVEWLKLG